MSPAHTKDRLSEREIRSMAYGILIPELPGLALTDPIHHFLECGGRAVLLGETRDEYLARRMSDIRRTSETADQVAALTQRLGEVAGRDVVVAMDQEIAGINRLHDIVGTRPSRDAFLAMSTDEITSTAASLGAEMVSLGVTMNLAPVLDIMTGPNGWLDGRAYGSDIEEVIRVGTAFVRGMVKSGVIVSAKHFPGHRGATHDPAVTVGVVEPNADGLDRDLLPFRSAIEAGAQAIMLGPTIVTAVDPDQPSSRSAKCVSLLRDTLAFTGLVVTDDLNSRSNSRGDSVAVAAVDALRAGADLLLVTGQVGSDGDLDAVAEAIVTAVRSGHVPVERLTAAVDRFDAVIATRDRTAGSTECRMHTSGVRG